MAKIGKITSGKEGCFKWNIESFPEEWGKKHQYWFSPHFTYSNQECYLRLRKVAKLIIQIKFCLYDSSFPSSHYVELQLRTECNIVSGLYGTTLPSHHSRAGVEIVFRKFLSEGYLTPRHDRLTVLLRVTELSDVFPDEFSTIKKMLEDFKSLLVSGENSDVTLVVGGKKFPAHRSILCARSPVFKAMLCHDTTERDSGTVNIDDCDPDRFQDFLTCVYTGSTRHIDTENVISLYTTSDKYLMGELKEACVSFMNAKMSVEGFCGIAILALRHEEKELLESLTNFFCENFKEISDTENWVTFFKDNPDDAYEHFIKPLLSRI